MSGSKEMIKKILDERKLIKDALKKNFPREWRDRLENEGGHSIPGPFQALLNRMDMGNNYGESLRNNTNYSNVNQLSMASAATSGLNYVNLESPLRPITNNSNATTCCPVCRSKYTKKLFRIMN